MTGQVSFEGQVRYWKPERAGGLAVADVSPDLIPSLGGLRQRRVQGTINGKDFVSSTMPAGDGRLALSVSRAMLTTAGLAVGDTAHFTIELAEPD